MLHLRDAACKLHAVNAEYAIFAASMAVTVLAYGATVWLSIGRRRGAPRLKS